MVYVKTSDIPKKAPCDPLEGFPKEQQTTSEYNYQLHPFLWDEIRSLGHGIISFLNVGKRKKMNMNGVQSKATVLNCFTTTSLCIEKINPD
ncbi:CLUMA_CG018571, isoform A [Clunio marinus]|uniref:CLUMA_CG018571, isoform A n=1 Tax=Clunio marinus TaxID=568069 RepID=A0A1J1IZY0_9DIPT|nr:CLUMA_CG018571, isoform A [Clunio marinus]